LRECEISPPLFKKTPRKFRRLSPNKLTRVAVGERSIGIASVRRLALLALAGAVAILRHNINITRTALCDDIIVKHIPYPGALAELPIVVMGRSHPLKPRTTSSIPAELTVFRVRVCETLDNLEFVLPMATWNAHSLKTMAQPA
jgi:hypothetical protein